MSIRTTDNENGNFAKSIDLMDTILNIDVNEKPSQIAFKFSMI